MTATTTNDEATVAEQLAGRLFEAGLAAVELATVQLGARLGLYAVLAGREPTSASEVAAAAGIHERYATEWLEQQAAAGFLTADGESDGRVRRYALPAGSEAVLLEPENLAFTLPLAELPEVAARVAPQLADAYRNGTGVPYADYGIHDVQAAFNRPAFVNLLTTEWLPTIRDVHDRLTQGARVAEFGCGEGWAAIALALGYPDSIVDGFDSDDASVAAARQHAANAGVDDRVRFEVVDVTQHSSAEAYDAVFCFEMLHDLARPVDALAAARRLTGARGPVIVMDERAGDTFAAPADPMERFLYAASVLHCLPVGMAEQPSAGTGTVMRPATMRRYASEAGFGRCEILPIEHPMFRFYRCEG